MSITAHPTLPKGGANHVAIVRQQPNANDLGTIIWDPIRAQACFHPTDPNYAPSATDSAQILALLNSFAR